MKRIIITGSSGLIGSEAAVLFGQQGYELHGLDNNQRARFFGSRGDTSWNLSQVAKDVPLYVHHDADIRDREAVASLVGTLRPACIIHCAAQPSHDLAVRFPFAVCMHIKTIDRPARWGVLKDVPLPAAAVRPGYREIKEYERQRQRMQAITEIYVDLSWPRWQR